MPQISPMNWMIISILPFIFNMLFNSSLNTPISLNSQKLKMNLKPLIKWM